MIALQVLGAVSFAVALWVAVTSSLSCFAGHFSLIAKYGSLPDDSIREEFLFASGFMGWVSFHNAMTVKIGEKGLHIGPMILFRPLFSRALPCIPWSEIQQVRKVESWIGSCFLGPKFEIRGTAQRITVGGNPGLALQARVQEIATKSAVPPMSLRPQ